MRKWLFPITLLFSFSVIAEDCSSVNLYEKPDNPLNKMPIYDQDGDGFCYAYTTAQLIDYHNLKKNPKHKLTSAHWIAFAHKSNNLKIVSKRFSKITSPRRAFGGTYRKHELAFSDITLAIRDARGIGICDADIVKQGIKDFKISELINDDEFLFLFNIIHRKAKERREKNTYTAEEDKKKIIDEALDEVLRTRLRDIFYSPLENSTVANFEKLKMSPENLCSAEPLPEAKDLYGNIMSAVSFDKKNKQLQYLGKHIFNKCFEPGAISKVEVPHFDHVGDLYASNAKILAQIDKALDTKDEPAGIGFCAKLLDDPNLKPPVRLGPHGMPPIPRVLALADDKNVENCSPHYSMIVGRRKQGTSCQYMIRNTYGPHFWNDHMDCTCELNGKQFDCNYKTHGQTDVKVLGCWINGGDLAESTFSVVNFK